MSNETDAAWRSMMSKVELQMNHIMAEAQKAPKYGSQMLPTIMKANMDTCLLIMKLMSERISALEEQATRP